MQAAKRRMLAAGALALALSAPAVGIAGPAAAVPNMSFHTSTSANNTNLGKIQSAYCPFGKRILGGGGYIIGGGDEVMLTELIPVTTSKIDYFQVNAAVIARPDGTAPGISWSVLAYAICGTAPAGLQYVSVTSTGSFATSHTATASCPKGKKVIGAGGSALPGFGFNVLDEVAPSSTLTSVRVTSYQTLAPSPLASRARAVAVCADPIPGLTLVNTLSSFDSSDKTVDVLCPAGTKVHSTGFDLLGGLGRVAVPAVFPSQPLNSVRLVAREDRTGITGNWMAWVYAICAT